MTTVAPSCPISHSQLPVNPRGTPTRFPAIPIATDLPSLIRSVNVMRDILRNITTSLTVNNTYLPRQPRQPKVWGDRNYTVSPYPDWTQVAIDNEEGFVGPDPKKRAYVERLHTIIFRNNERDDDNLLKWQYRVPLTGKGGGPVESFREDFFERVIEVHWKKESPDIFKSVTWRFSNISQSDAEFSSEFFCRPVDAPFPTNGPYYIFSNINFGYELAAHQPEVDDGLTVSGTPTTPTAFLAEGVLWIGLSGVSHEQVSPSIPYTVSRLFPGPPQCYGFDTFFGFSSVFGRPAEPFIIGADIFNIGVVSTTGITGRIDAGDGKGPQEAERVGTQITWGNEGINVVIGFKLAA